MPGRTNIGFDLHAASVFACGFDRESGEQFSREFPARDRASLVQWLDELPQPCETICEAGNSSFVFARHLIGCGVPCTVVAQGAFGARRHKTDRRDAMALACHLASGQAEGVLVPSEKQQASRSLAHRRYDLSARMSATKKKIRTFVDRADMVEQGERVSWSKTGIARLRTLVFPEAQDGLAFSTLLDEWEALERSLRLVEASMGREIDRNPLMRRLSALDGVGVVTAFTAVADAGDFSRFSTSAEYVSHAGLVPRARNSGKRKAQAPSGTHACLESCYKAGAASVVRARRPPTEVVSPDILEMGNDAIRRAVLETLKPSIEPRRRIAIVSKAIAEQVWQVATSE